MSSQASLSIQAKLALRILGEMIKVERLRKRMSQSNLAERLNRSRYTVMALEKGDPNVAIGVVFEAATIVGVQLLAEDKTNMQKLSNTISSLVSVLPKKAKRKTGKVEDDF